MSTWKVTKRLTGEVVYAYTADEPVEWPGMEFSTHNHLLQVPEAESVASGNRGTTGVRGA